MADKNAKMNQTKINAKGSPTTSVVSPSSFTKISNNSAKTPTKMKVQPANSISKKTPTKKSSTKKTSTEKRKISERLKLVLDSGNSEALEKFEQEGQIKTQIFADEESVERKTLIIPNATKIEDFDNREFEELEEKLDDDEETNIPSHFLPCTFEQPSDFSDVFEEDNELWLFKVPLNLNLKKIHNSSINLQLNAETGEKIGDIKFENSLVNYSLFNANEKEQEFRQLVNIFPSSKEKKYLLGKPFSKQIDLIESINIPTPKIFATDLPNHSEKIEQIPDLKVRFIPIGCVPSKQQMKFMKKTLEFLEKKKKEKRINTSNNNESLEVENKKEEKLSQTPQKEKSKTSMKRKSNENTELSTSKKQKKIKSS